MSVNQNRTKTYNRHDLIECSLRELSLINSSGMLRTETVHRRKPEVQLQHWMRLHWCHRMEYIFLKHTFSYSTFIFYYQCTIIITFVTGGKKHPED